MSMGAVRSRSGEISCSRVDQPAHGITAANIPKVSMRKSAITRALESLKRVNAVVPSQVEAK